MAKSRPPFYIGVMKSQRKPRQNPPTLPRQTETQLSLLPDDVGTEKRVKRGARLVDGREEERAADSAAYLERRNLERFLKRMGYTVDEWEKRRRHYLEKPQSDEELNSNTWKAAKLRHSGAAVEVALRRQKMLAPDLWMVAFFMVQGYNRTNIPHLIHLKQRRVDMLIAELRSIVNDEFHTDTDAAIARWFFGHTIPRS